MEKGKELRAIRKRLEWNQETMGRALNLDPTYLSQLENGRRSVDDSYLEKAGAIEKSNFVKTARAEEALYSEESVRSRCHDYLSKVLEACEGNEDRLRWTLVELQMHFPISSKPLSGAQELGLRAAGEHKPKS